jgi:ribose 5-phosphate isomerase B
MSISRKLITERDVLRVSDGSRIVYTGKGSIITPAARDAARKYGVSFEPAPVDKSEVLEIKEVFPVKVIAIASDHGGFELKEILVPYLRSLGFITHDLGPANDKPCDYPEFAIKVAETVASGKADRGIMIDSVGIGSAMAANRVKGILAAKCNNGFEARSAREHNYANVLTLGAKIIGVEIAKEIVKIFMETPGGEERHQKRALQILAYK